MADANIRAVITAEDRASGVIKNFGKDVDSTATKTTASLNASLLAAGAATAGIVAFGKKSLDAFNAQDLATVRLQTGINNVKTATDKHIDSLLKQATALQKTTRFSDEAYISAQGILSTFQLNQKAIEKLTPRLADMSEGLARVTGEMPDLEGNAILIAKAIGGEDVAGLTGALRRVGVVMTKTQEDLLKTGSVEDRVGIITQVLDQNFKNMAESAGGTTSGKLAILKNQFGELEEKVGKLIANVLTPLLNILIQHPVALEAVTVAVGALTAAFVAMKVASAVGLVIEGLTVAYSALAAAATAASLAVAAPIVLVVVGVAAIWAAVNAANALRDAWNNASNAERNADNTYNDMLKRARADYAAGKISKARLEAVTEMRASGGPVTSGSPYIVGEQGPELFVPKSNGTIVPNNQLSSKSMTYNLNVNVGTFVGTEMEKRKLAEELFRAYNDLQSARGMA